MYTLNFIQEKTPDRCPRSGVTSSNSTLASCRPIISSFIEMLFLRWSPRHYLQVYWRGKVLWLEAIVTNWVVYLDVEFSLYKSNAQYSYRPSNCEVAQSPKTSLKVFIACTVGSVDTWKTQDSKTIKAVIGEVLVATNALLRSFKCRTWRSWKV